MLFMLFMCLCLYVVYVVYIVDSPGFRERHVTDKFNGSAPF